jgi:hypothetical protein
MPNVMAGQVSFDLPVTFRDPLKFELYSRRFFQFDALNCGLRVVGSVELADRNGTVAALLSG